jgi:hypothetical protein
VGEPERAIARAGEDRVALAVAFEGPARAVVAVAVGLDDEAGGGEEEVDPEAGDPRSGPGAL